MDCISEQCHTTVIVEELTWSMDPNTVNQANAWNTPILWVYHPSATYTNGLILRQKYRSTVLCAAVNLVEMCSKPVLVWHDTSLLEHRAHLIIRLERLPYHACASRWFSKCPIKQSNRPLAWYLLLHESAWKVGLWASIFRIALSRLFVRQTSSLLEYNNGGLCCGQALRCMHCMFVHCFWSLMRDGTIAVPKATSKLKDQPGSDHVCYESLECGRLLITKILWHSNNRCHLSSRFPWNEVSAIACYFQLVSHWVRAWEVSLNWTSFTSLIYFA